MWVKPLKTAMLVLTLLGLAACGGGVDNPERKTASTGEKLYNEKGCAGCHGRGPDQGQWPITQAAFEDGAITGAYIAGSMPPGNVGSCPRATCANDIATYMKSWFKPQSSAAASSVKSSAVTSSAKSVANSSSASYTTSSSQAPAISSHSSSTASSTVGTASSLISSSTSNTSSSAIASSSAEASSSSVASSSNSSSVSSIASSSSPAIANINVGKTQFEAKCGSCHGNLGEGSTDRGIDPRDYSQTELQNFTKEHLPNGNFGPCNEVENCALNTSSYLKTLDITINAGVDLYSSDQYGCLGCHEANVTKISSKISPADSKKKPLATITKDINETMPKGDIGACNLDCSAKIALFWKMTQWEKSIP